MGIDLIGSSRQFRAVLEDVQLVAAADLGRTDSRRILILSSSQSMVCGMETACPILFRRWIPSDVKLKGRLR